MTSSSIDTDCGEGREYTPDPLLHDGLVHQIARKFFHRRGDLEFSDLLQAGRIGLVFASRRYDPTKGAKFATYASYWIRRYIDDEIVYCGNYIRVSRYHYSTQRARASEEVQEAGRKALTIRKWYTDGQSILANDSKELRELAESLEELGSALDSLPPMERRVISEHFGLGGHPARSFHELAKATGLSFWRIRTIYINAMDRLKSILLDDEQ